MLGLYRQTSKKGSHWALLGIYGPPEKRGGSCFSVLFSLLLQESSMQNPFPCTSSEVSAAAVQVADFVTKEQGSVAALEEPSTYILGSVRGLLQGRRHWKSSPPGTFPVLQAFIWKPFKPIEDYSLTLLTLKTVIFISGLRRVSGIHAFSISDPF